VVLGAVALALLSGSVGLVGNHAASTPLPILAPYRASLPEGVEEIEPRTAWEDFQDGNAIFADAREIERYQEGHVPGAISLPADDLEQHLAGRSRYGLLETMAQRATIIVYCDGPECRASQILARALQEAGVRGVRVMTEGWPGWEEAGYPISREGSR